MANLKATTIGSAGSTDYLRLPIGNTAERPNSNYPSGANQNANPGYMRINSTTGKLEIYSGGAWESTVISFPYRTIITQAFVTGGYKDSQAWRNVNRTYVATDTTVSLGDVLERAFNYQWGANSKDYCYVFGAGDTHAAASNYTTAWNMRTEVAATDISRTMAASRSTFGGVFQEDRYAWITGGEAGTRIEEYNMYSKTLIGTITPTFTAGNCWGMSHENIGIIYGNGQSTFTYATRTIAARGGTEPGAHHQQKSVMSKFTYCYAGNEGTYNGGNTFRKTNMVTNTTVWPNNAAATPVGYINKLGGGNNGEENYTIGQDWMYMLGVYNGSGQTNVSGKFVYATETSYTGGASLEPKGSGIANGAGAAVTINGRSSAVCGWCD